MRGLWELGLAISLITAGSIDSCAAFPPTIPNLPPSKDFDIIVKDCDGRTSSVLAAVNNQRPLDLTLQQLTETPISHGFVALFKSYNSREPLLRLLDRVKARTALPNLFPTPSLRRGPEFVCVTPQTYRTYPFFDRDPRIECIRTRSIYLYVTGTPYLFLCPQFFTLPKAPVEPYNQCPPVRNNIFTRASEAPILTEYQTYYILVGLVEFYLQGQKLTEHTQPPITWRVNEALRLDWESSLRNPVNSMMFLAFVEQGCTEFPDISKPPFVPIVSAANRSIAAGDDLMDVSTINRSRVAVPTFPADDGSLHPDLTE